MKTADPRATRAAIQERQAAHVSPGLRHPEPDGRLAQVIRPEAVATLLERAAARLAGGKEAQR